MFRKKPVEFEAFQMTEERRYDNSEWPNWLNRAWQMEPHEEGAVFCVDGEKPLFCQAISYGMSPITWGDYLIPGPGDTITPWSQEAFEMHHESVDGPITPSIRDRICAGAVALLFGYLTTRPGVLKFGASEDCAPTALALKEWADNGGISLDVDAIFPGDPLPAEEPCPTCNGTTQVPSGYKGAIRVCEDCLTPNTKAIVKLGDIRGISKRRDLTSHQQWLRTLKILGKEN